MATVAPLYEDDFCLVGDQNLTIKKYFFPSRKNVVLSVDDIRVVYFAPQDESKYANIRTWGKTKNECYWAPDFRRCLPGNKHRRHNVVVDIEDGLRRGFTVENIDAFLDAIRSVCSFHIIIADNLNV